jgi:hypothetical protein
MARSTLALWALSLLCLAGMVNARGAFEATDANFDKAVLGSGKAAFVKFLAPW